MTRAIQTRVDTQDGLVPTDRYMCSSVLEGTATAGLEDPDVDGPAGRISMDWQCAWGSRRREGTVAADPEDQFLDGLAGRAGTELLCAKGGSGREGPARAGPKDPDAGGLAARVLDSSTVLSLIPKILVFMDMQDGLGSTGSKCAVVALRTLPQLIRKIQA